MTTPAALANEQTSGDSFFARRFRQANRSGQPAWLARLREDAFDRFEELSFPTIDHEEWKYTNLAALAKSEFASDDDEACRNPALDYHAIEQFVYAEAADSRLVFVDGRFSPELSRTAALDGTGVVAVDLIEALGDERHQATLRERLGQIADHKEHALHALNAALFAGGAFIRVPRGTRLEAPIHLLFVTTASGERAPLRAVFPRVIVDVEREAEATIIESYASADREAAYWMASAVEAFVADGARLTAYKVQRESESAYHTATTAARLGRDARFDLTTINLGARLSRHDIGVELPHEGAECWVDGLYIVGGEQHTDTHSTIDHISPHCASHQIYKGILDGRSRAVFNGKVFVRRDARLTDAQQTNKNLLLSREARVDTKPQLEIFNDDVKCAHGATVGQLEEEELFYLTSRGLPEAAARNLLTYGFAEEIVEKVKISSIKKQLDEAILNRLGAQQLGV